MRVAPFCLAPFCLAILCHVFGCQLTTDFALEPIAETSEALCSDGLDGDFDGLTDCQDWNCLDTPPCCDIPEIVVDDDFSYGPPSCDDVACSDATCVETSCGADSDVWHSWACPFAKVCGGALHIDKTQCFAGGVLSRATSSLDSGLNVTVSFRGVPETLGYLEAALTLQDETELGGAFDECGSSQEVVGVTAVRAVASGEGYQLVALFRNREVGRSEEFPGDVDTTLEIEIDRERFIHYLADGTEFAVSDVELPDSEVQVRLALSGITESMSVSQVRIAAGIRCQAPEQWVPRNASIEASELLAGERISSLSFDRDEVFHPSIRSLGSSYEVFYSGCPWPNSEVACDPYRLGMGRAILANLQSAKLERDGEGTWVTPNDLTAAGVLLGEADPDTSICVLGESERFGFGPADAGIRGTFVGLDENLDSTALVLSLPRRDAWDAGQVCCPTALEGPDGVMRLWYSGKSLNEDAVYSIGLATSTDGGVTFDRVGSEPVLEAGPSSAFDGGGVRNPEVIYDSARRLYRMWYEAQDFFGQVTIGYAVSTDGVEWHPYPGNPVLSPQDVGLASVGGPAVHRTSDGRLFMIVHGTTLDEPRRRLFALTNEGALSEP